MAAVPKPTMAQTMIPPILDGSPTKELRARIAAAALAGFSSSQLSPEAIAKVCVQRADALLRELEKGGAE